MVIAIIGPTGVGKTKISIELAKRLNGEIINADSMQVYKELNIGTAKIKDEEKENITHHLFDIKSVKEEYNVFEYQKDARNKIDEIVKKGKTPILVGGTGLYVKAVLYNYEFKDEQIKNEYNDLTNEELYEKLLKIDKDTKIHINNRKRVIRAINYYENNHESIEQKEKSDKLIYDAKIIGLKLDRDILYDRINKRVDIMISEGLIEEAQNLYNQNIKTKPIYTAIGYKELYEAFDNKITLEEAIENIKQNSRKYAKRQFTFLNNQLDLKWFSPNEIEEIIKFLH